MKNIMTQKDIKNLEVLVSKATGWDNVEIDVPVSMQDLPSLEYRLLEMENKSALSKVTPTPRQANKAAKLAARNNMINKAMKAVDSVLDVIEEPKKLLDIKPIGAVAHYFFVLEDDEVETPAPMQEEAAPVKPQVVKEGKVVYVNFNK